MIQRSITVAAFSLSIYIMCGADLAAQAASDAFFCIDYYPVMFHILKPLSLKTIIRNTRSENNIGKEIRCHKTDGWILCGRRAAIRNK